MLRDLTQRYNAKTTLKTHRIRPSKVSIFFLNLFTFSMVASVLIYVGWGYDEMTETIIEMKSDPLSLEPFNLIEYGLRTMFRMIIAVIISILFSIIYANLAAKNKYAEQVLIPLLDILQSVPILGYISFTVTGFLALFPGSVLGPEMVAIFAIFTSQAWNITLSLYQSFKNIPSDLREASKMLKFSAWRKFWILEMPYATPQLIWNLAISMSGGWFFVVASEVIAVGNYQISLPGIGSYIALALKEKDLMAVFYALLAMIIIIIFYDLFLIKPLIAWSDKFKYETSNASLPPKSLVLEILKKVF